MEVNLAPNKIKQISYLAIEWSDKEYNLKILLPHWLKWQQIENKHIFFFTSALQDTLINVVCSHVWFLIENMFKVLKLTALKYFCISNGHEMFLAMDTKGFFNLKSS